MKSVVNKSPWYSGGLHFECLQCGRCCSGPAQGYIWVSRPEIQIIVDFLKITASQLRRDYLRRVGLRTTIVEQPSTKDCIFLNHGLHGLHGDKTRCIIYPVRPSQCRMWPFWPINLANPDAWNGAAQRCPGINRGKCYSHEQIKKIQSNKKWWQNPTPTPGS